MRMNELSASGPGWSQPCPATAQPSTTAIARPEEHTASAAVDWQERAGRPHEGAAQAVTDQAVGVVMALGRLRADQARTVLAGVSRRTSITLLRIAELVTAWASSGELNLGIRIALEEAIRHQRPARPTSQASG